eukprot:15350039-Ditylum_brightwellii.AAC.1
MASALLRVPRDPHGTDVPTSSSTPAAAEMYEAEASAHYLLVWEAEDLILLIWAELHRNWSCT